MARDITLPVPDAVTEPFWEAAREGRLLIQGNPKSGVAQWYPRVHCLDDWDTAPEWITASGRATLYSYTVVPKSDFIGLPAPYVFAIVELEEGVQMETTLTGVDPSQVKIGMALEVAFEPADAQFPIPRFRPRVS